MIKLSEPKSSSPSLRIQSLPSRLRSLVQRQQKKAEPFQGRKIEFFPRRRVLQTGAPGPLFAVAPHAQHERAIDESVSDPLAVHSSRSAAVDSRRAPYQTPVPKSSHETFQPMEPLLTL